jgi:hypothetical protein
MTSAEYTDSEDFTSTAITTEESANCDIKEVEEEEKEKEREIIVETICDDEELEMKSFDTQDFTILSKSLQSISGYAHEYESSEVKDETNFRRKVKLEYGVYACEIKPDIANSKWKRWLMKLVTKYSFLIISLILCCFLLYSIINTLIGKQTRIPILYAITYLILFNPFYSFLTVTIELINFKSSSSMNKSSFTNVSEVENKVKGYVKNNGNTDEFVKYFTGSGSQKFDETLSQKMENLDAVDKFFANQQDFLLKSRNPFISLNSNDVLDKCLQFLLNTNGMLITYLEGDNPGQLYFKSSQTIRDNTKRILEQTMGIMFDTSSFTSYEVNLYDEMQTDIQSLIDNVQICIYKNSVFKSKNLYITSERKTSILNTDTVDIGVNLEDGKRNIINKFKRIVYKIKLLKYLGLPEEEILKQYIFKKEYIISNSDYESLILTSQQNIELLIKNEQFIKKVIGLIMNNNNFYKLTTDALIKETIDTLPTIYEGINSEYLNEDSECYKKTKKFISNLQNDFLKKDFVRNNRIEMTIIKNILLSEISSLSFKPSTIILYLKNKINKEKLFQKSLIENRYVSNIAKVFQHVFVKLEQERANEQLYDDGQDNIENQHKYISFEEFDVKISNFDDSNINQLSNNVQIMSGKITYFIDKLNDINDKMESKQMMNKYYKEYLLLYYFSSFFIMLDSVWKYYFDSPFDISYMESNQNSIINNMAKKQEEVE